MLRPVPAIKLIFLILSLAFATLLVYEMNGRPAVGIDDANIFFSYAENFAAGKGMVYANNPERVEGFTSMLWMLVCSLIFKLGAGESAILLLSVFLLALTHIIIAAFIGERAAAAGSRPLPFQAAYLLMIALSAPYMSWMTITLMDTCLWGLVVAILALAVLSPPDLGAGSKITVVGALASCLVRPESLLVTPVALFLIWHQRTGTGRVVAANAAARTAAGFIGLTALLTCFRLFYFGYPLPNTWYAKVSPSLVYNFCNGLEYFYDFITGGIIAGAGIALLPAFFLVKTFRRGQPSFLYFAGFILMLCLLPVITGGDHFALSRFYQPVFPLLCLSLTLFFIEMKSAGPGIAAFVLRQGVLLLAISAVLDYALFAWGNGATLAQWHWESPIDNEFRIAEKGIELGHRLNRLFASLPIRPAVGVIPAGGIARSYDGPIIDLLGLNHIRIAHYRGPRLGKKNHASFEREMFFELMPDILIGFPPGPAKGSEFTNETLKGLLLDEKFVASYCYGELSRRESDGPRLKSFFRNDFVGSLDDQEPVKFIQTMRFNGSAYVSVIGE